MLSQTVEYALRATLYIARDSSKPARVTAVARAIEAPPTYLAKILGQLARAGLLASTRGPAGGFRLEGNPADVCLSDVVAVFEPPVQRRCLLGNGPCGQDPSCVAHKEWAPIAQSLDRYFAATTLADLLSNRTST